MDVSYIFCDIEAFLQNEEAVIKLLALLPKARQGISLLAHGLFAENDSIQQMSKNILIKIQSMGGALGQKAIAGLSDFYKFKLI